MDGLDRVKQVNKERELRSLNQWTKTAIGAWRLRYKTSTFFVSPSSMMKGTWHVTIQDDGVKDGRQCIEEGLPTAEAGKKVVEDFIVGDE